MIESRLGNLLRFTCTRLRAWRTLRRLARLVSVLVCGFPFAKTDRCVGYLKHKLPRARLGRPRLA